MPSDSSFLTLAARAALRGHGYVEPNPMVGCVLVRGGEILAVGHHRRFGSLHAEREALASCRARGIDPAGATAYVTLEPCNGHGKQPPCTQALIEARVARVVYAVRDPNPTKSGGVELLRARGITVDHVPHELSERLGGPFIKGLSGLPWVSAKWAQTIDGRIATRTGQSQWISSKASRARVHRMRGRVDAILTGIGTVLADDPRLTARAGDGGGRGGGRVRRIAQRVVVDSRLMTPVDSKLAASAREIPVIILTAASALAPVAPLSTSSGAAAAVEGAARATEAARTRRREALEAAGVTVIPVRATTDGEVNLEEGLRALASRGISTVLVEAGPRLLGALMDASLIDEAIVHLAPMILADQEARAVATGRTAPLLSDASRWTLQRLRRTGDDVELWYRRAR